MPFSLTYQDYLNANPQLMGGSEGGQGTSSLLSQNQWGALGNAQWNNIGGGVNLTPDDPRFTSLLQESGGIFGDSPRGLSVVNGVAPTGPGMFVDPSKVYQGDGYYAFDSQNLTPQFQARANSGGLSDRMWALAPLLVVGGGLALGASGALGGAEAGTGLAEAGVGGAGDFGLSVPGALPSVPAPGAVGGLADTPSLAGLGGSGAGAGGLLSGGGGIANTLERSGLSAILQALGGGGNGRPGTGLGGTGGGGGTGMGFDIGSLLSLIALGRQSGLGGNGVGTPAGAQNIANQAADRADPWGTSGRRGQFMDQLTPDAVQKLLNPDPNEITQDPAYQFQLNQGISAINQGDAAQGTLRSGNRLTELQTYGQGLASQFENNQFQENIQRLGAMGNLAGVNAGSPVASGAALVSGFEGATTLQNNGLNGLLGNLLNGGGSSLSALGSSLTSLLANGGKGLSDWLGSVFGNSSDPADASFFNHGLDFTGGGGDDFPSSFFDGSGDSPIDLSSLFGG